MSKKVKKITLGFVLSWLFGILFGLSGIGFAVTGYFGAGIPLILISLILLPPLNKFIEERFNFQLSGGLKLVIVIILFMIYAVNLPMNYSYDTDYQSETENGLSLPDDSQNTKPSIYKFGDKVIVGDFAYTFHNMSVAYEIGDYSFGTFLGEKADGIFVIFDVTIENVGKESKTLWGSYVNIIDDQERKFEHDSTAEFYLRDEAFSFEQMQPGLPKRGKIVFDVPTDLSGYIEIVSDNIWSTEKKYVSWA